MWTTSFLWCTDSATWAHGCQGLFDLLAYALASVGFDAYHDRMSSGRPTRFEHSRYLGDKRTQVVYDLDNPATPKSIIDEIVTLGVGASFGPDTLAEARNRNYREYKPKGS